MAGASRFPPPDCFPRSGTIVIKSLKSRVPHWLRFQTVAQSAAETSADAGLTRVDNYRPQLLAAYAESANGLGKETSIYRDRDAITQCNYSKEQFVLGGFFMADEIADAFPDRFLIAGMMTAIPVIKQRYCPWI